MYGAKYIAKEESEKDSLANRLREEFEGECVRQNFLLHKKLKTIYKDVKKRDLFHKE